MTATRRASTGDWPELAADVAGELRRQLDVALARNLELETSMAALRAVVQGEAEDLAEAGEADERSSRFWFALWGNNTRIANGLKVRISKLEGWLLAQGNEASRLQAELDRSREQNAGLSRQLEETERDYTEMYADREVLAGKLARCECSHGEAVH